MASKGGVGQLCKAFANEWAGRGVNVNAIAPGHTLSITNLPSGKYFNLKGSFTGSAGKITTRDLPVSTGYFRVPNNVTVVATNVDFEVKCRIEIAGALYAHDYSAIYVGNDIIGAGDIFVHGTFTPGEAYKDGESTFHGCTMMDGSSIDLAAKTAPWPVRSSHTGDGARLVTFENGAKVSVKLGSRRIAKDEAIMTWTDATRPANLSTLTFKGVFDNRIVPLAKRDDGLYMPRGFMLVVR